MDVIVQALLALSIVPVVIWLFSHIAEEVKRYPADDRVNQFLTFVIFKGFIIFTSYGIAFGVSETGLFLLAPFIAAGLIYYSSTLK